MKVILVGLPQTGIQTVVAALKELHMTVYDVMDHYGKFGNRWLKVVENGVTNNFFNQIYRDIDVVAGFPVWYFWEEIHKAHPEAKVNCEYYITCL